MSVLEKTGDEDRANRTCHTTDHRQSVLKRESDSYLSSNIGDGGWCDMRHSMDARIARPSGFRLFFDRTRGSKYMLVSLRESLSS